MENFTYKSIYGEYPNCYFELGRYENGNLAIDIWSSTEGPVTRVTVNPDIKLSDTTIAIKNYSENEGMVEWLCRQGLIDLDPINVIPNGFIEIPVHALTAKGLRVFKY